MPGYFDDIEVGRVVSLGAAALSQKAIESFGGVVMAFIANPHELFPGNARNGRLEFWRFQGAIYYDNGRERCRSHFNVVNRVQ